MSNLPLLHRSITERLRAAGCVYAEDEAQLLVASVPPEALDEKVALRAAGVPLEYVLGWADFCGHRIALEEGVFIPRRRSEFLAEQAMGLLKAGDVLLDMCCGSGALAAAIAARFAAEAPLTVWAADIDPTAVRCARNNLAAVAGQVVQGDLYAPLPTSLKGHVKVIVANAPYVPSDETELLPREARLHEPRFTFDGGSDGLAVQRRIAEAAPAWLARGGSLLVETAEAAAEGTKAILERSGLAARIVQSQAWDATVVIGKARPAG